MSSTYAEVHYMAEQRHVRLFRNGRNQAVRIPVEFELPGDEAIMHRDGDRRDRTGAQSRARRAAQDDEAAGGRVSCDRRSHAGTGESALTRYMPDTTIISDLIT